MYPEKGCYTCICSSDFENKPVEENPSCRRVECGASLRNSRELRKGCVPTYYGNDGCCPISWRCPDEKDEIIDEGKSAVESTEKCEFGKLRMNVGDAVKSDDKCNTCKCTYPPMMHCIRTPDCH